MPKVTWKRNCKVNGKFKKRGDTGMVSSAFYNRHRHLVFKPKETQDTGPTETKNQCEYCDRTFDSPQGRAAHMRFCDKKE